LRYPVFGTVWPEPEPEPDTKKWPDIRQTGTGTGYRYIPILKATKPTVKIPRHYRRGPPLQLLQEVDDKTTEEELTDSPRFTKQQLLQVNAVQSQ